MKRIYAALVGLTLLVSSAQGANYQFTTVADTAGGSFTQLFIPAINNSGTVVFRGIKDVNGSSLDGIYSAAPTGVIADANDARFASFGDPSISNTGIIVFDAFEDGGLDNGIYSGAAGANNPPATLLYDTSDEFSCLFNPSVNSSGLVAFRGETLSIGGNCDSVLNVPAGIYAGSDSENFILIADNSGGTPDDFIDVDFEPRINDDGTVVFTAERNSGEIGVYTGNGGSLTTVVEGGGVFFSFQGSSINCAGMVAFVAFSAAGGGFSIMKGDGSEEAATVIDSNSVLSDFRQPSINCRETIAFTATGENFGPPGLYTIADGVVSKIIEKGDTLEGLTVEQITFSNTGLNDNNQIVFLARLSDDDPLSADNRYIFIVNTTDSDGDGTADDVDTDDDNDGVLDGEDAFPLDPDESADTDSDGIGNNADTDDDGDGILDDFEVENDLDPLDSADALEDRDGDGFSNAAEYRARTNIDDPLSTPDDNAAAVQVILELLLNKDSE